MTAKQKFEARLDALGLREEWELNGFAGTQTDKEIVVLVHYDNDKSDPYSELHYPRFDAMTREQMNELTHHFATEYCNSDSEKESEFFSKLASWCAGFGPTPLFPCDVYTNLNPTEDIQFEDDEDDEEEEYQHQIADNADEIRVMQQRLSLDKHRLEQMIKKEVRRGHNLVGRFDPYPGWDSHHLCGYEIENKTMVVEEMADGYMALALYQEGYDTERLHLSASDFPIEVLFNIYKAMK